MTRREIIDNLRNLREEASRNYKAEILGIFGSYARDDHRAGSDLDVLVRFKKGASLFELSGLTEYLEEKLNIKVDVLSEKAIRSEIRDKILSDTVYL
ncbi:MAG: nucleotidyltransferase family protein [Thermodesulfobacteriota bacterium]